MGTKPKFGTLPRDVECPACGLGGYENPLPPGFKLTNHVWNERCQVIRQTRECWTMGLVPYPGRASSITEELRAALGGVRAFTCAEVGGLGDRAARYTENVSEQVWMPLWVRIITESVVFDTYNVRRDEALQAQIVAIRDRAIVRLHQEKKGQALEAVWRLSNADVVAGYVADLCAPEAHEVYLALMERGYVFVGRRRNVEP